ncbi:MAG: hypothetical protein PHV07_06940, partial [Oscillospiraceae bacterium]|nr:hypothetical protein [Oscillospiraceae bacterium]
RILFVRQGGGRRRAIARRERQRSLANKRPRRLVDFYLELVLYVCEPQKVHEKFLVDFFCIIFGLCLFRLDFYR